MQTSITFKVPENVNWKEDGRLKLGSLVVLCHKAEYKQDYQILIAVVTNSKEKDLQSGNLDVFFENVPINFQNRTYTMLESKIFYVPYRASLEALLKIKQDPKCFPEFLLG